MDQYWTLIPEEEGQIVTSLLFFIFRQAFETSGPVCACGVCVLVRMDSVDRTQSGVSNCNCPAQSGWGPLLSRLQWISSNKHSCLMRPEVTSSVQAYPPVMFPTSSWNTVGTSVLAYLFNLIQSGSWFESATPGFNAGGTSVELLTPLCWTSSSPTAAAFLKSLHLSAGLILLSLISLCSSSDIFLKGDKSSQNKGNTSAALACRIITRHWAAHCCLKLLWTRQNSFLTSQCCYQFNCCSCGWHMFTDEIKIHVKTHHIFLSLMKDSKTFWAESVDAVLSHLLWNPFSNFIYLFIYFTVEVTCPSNI